MSDTDNLYDFDIAELSRARDMLCAIADNLEMPGMLGLSDRVRHCESQLGEVESELCKASRQPAGDNE